MKYRNVCMSLQNLSKQCRLVLPGIFSTEGKKFLEVAIAEANAATDYDKIKKTMKAITDKFDCQSISCLVKEHVGSCNIC